MRRGVVEIGFSLAVLVGLVGCDQERSAEIGGGILIVTPRDPDPLTQRLVEDASGYLETIAGAPPEVVELQEPGFDILEAAAAEHRAGLVLALDANAIDDERIDFQRMIDLGDSGFVLETQDAGNWSSRLEGEGATFVLTAGNSKLARQYAVYEFLRRLGVRFYHPEQEYVPTHEWEDLRELAKTPTVLHREGEDYRPDYRWRSWSFHSSHPLEHLEAFSDANHPIDEAVRVNEWIVKNKGNRFKGPGRGIASEEARARRADELEALRVELGFGRSAGITLHNEQQGASAEIDRDSKVPVRQQIETLVEQKLSEVPDASWFGIHFGPTEFTTTPDQETVNWIDWAGAKARQLRPGIEVEINNHITGSQPSPNFDDLGCPNGTNEGGRIDYYDLAFHTDPGLGVNVHTVMFYPLEGPARVYNQRSFDHKLCLMQKASAAGRPLTWFPEGSWWLSFDNPIPVYLPLYIWARGRDIELLKPLLAARGAGTLAGHRMFNSGQEWGYWQQDYAVGLWAWNSDVTLQQVLGELFDPVCEPSSWREGCEARATAIEVLTDVMDHQRQWFLERADFQGRPGGLYSYFAGEDQADEIAAASGFEFRPVRVSFATVNSWKDDALDLFEQTDLAALEEIAAAHVPWIDRLQVVRSQVPEAGLPWFDEMLDGIEINELRARQALLLYRAVLAYRRAARAGDPDPAAAAQADFDAAQMILARAEQVIRRREAAYRYPAAQTHGGGLTQDTAVSNGTTYPYRVHTKTHLLTYWHNRNDQVRLLLEGGDISQTDQVALDEALAAPGTDLEITWPPLDDLGGELEVGKVGTLQAGEDTMLSLPAGEGWWPVFGELTTDGRTIDVVGGIARASRRSRTPPAEVTLLEPQDPLAQSVLASVFPALQWGWLESSVSVVVAPDPEDDGSVRFDALAHAPVETGDAQAFETAPISLTVPVALSSGGSALSIGLSQTVISGAAGAEGLSDPVTMTGRISVDDLVLALRELAGFDEAGALQTLSGILGFDPTDPPATVPFTAEFSVAPMP